MADRSNVERQAQVASSINLVSHYVDALLYCSFMYWSDSRSARIERALLNNGSNREVFVSEGLVAPGGLAMDVFGEYTNYAIQ